jgi:hypothetical protein
MPRRESRRIKRRQARDLTNGRRAQRRNQPGSGNRNELAVRHHAFAPHEQPTPTLHEHAQRSSKNTQPAANAKRNAKKLRVGPRQSKICADAVSLAGNLPALISQFLRGRYPFGAIRHFGIGPQTGCKT